MNRAGTRARLAVVAGPVKSAGSISIGMIIDIATNIRIG